MTEWLLGTEKVKQNQPALREHRPLKLPLLLAGGFFFFLFFFFVCFVLFCFVLAQRTQESGGTASSLRDPGVWTTSLLIPQDPETQRSPPWSPVGPWPCWLASWP